MRTLPLADRCWALFCEGQSFAAIGRTLDLDRETVARYVRAIHAEVQADRRADRALALTRALAAQQRIQATAWELLALARANLAAPGACPGSEEPGSAAAAPLPAPPPPLPSQGRGRELGGTGERPATFADCARLLNIILASTRETARLELLYDPTSSARTADQEPQDKTVRIIIERVGDPYMPPASSPAHEPTSDPAAPDPSGASSPDPVRFDHTAPLSELAAGCNPASLSIAADADSAGASGPVQPDHPAPASGLRGVILCAHIAAHSSEHTAALSSASHDRPWYAAGRLTSALRHSTDGSRVVATAR